MNINIYNPYVREELYLMHHGIAGQKWGKRNGPPYPLSAGAHSASEKKAGWRKSLSDRSDDHKYAKAVKKEIKLLKKEHKILRKEGQSNKWSNALNKTLDQEDKRHTLEDKIGRERAGKVNDKLRAKRNKSIKTAIKRKIDSITPEQKAKAKKIAIKALKIAGAVAITAAVAYAGFKFGVNPLVSKKLNNVSSKAAIAERHLRANRYATENRIMRGASTMSKKAFDINENNWSKQFDKWAKADTISRRSNLAKRVYSSKGMSDLEKLKSQFNPYRIKQGWIHSNKNLR